MFVPFQCVLFNHSPFNHSRSTSEHLHHKGKNMTAAGCRLVSNDEINIVSCLLCRASCCSDIKYITALLDVFGKTSLIIEHHRLSSVPV